MLVTMAVLTGCGGGTDSGPMRATLTPDGCAYEGDTSPAPGVFNVEVQNQTPYGASFALWELADGSTVEEIEEIYRMAIREHERTGTLPGESHMDAALAPAVEADGFGHDGRPRRYVATSGERAHREIRDPL